MTTQPHMKNSEAHRQAEANLEQVAMHGSTKKPIMKCVYCDRTSQNLTMICDKNLGRSASRIGHKMEEVMQ